MGASIRLQQIYVHAARKGRFVTREQIAVPRRQSTTSRAYSKLASILFVFNRPICISLARSSATRVIAASLGDVGVAERAGRCHGVSDAVSGA